MRLVTAGAGAHIRHMRETAGVFLAVVFVGDLRLAAVDGGAGREVMHVQEVELEIGRIERQAGNRLVHACRRLAALMAGHAQIGVVIAGVDADAAGEVDLGHGVPRIGQ